MPKSRANKWAAIPRGQDNALGVAVAARDADVLRMVEQALRHNEVTLAFQPVVEAKRPEKVAFYEGLIRIFDATGRIIPAKEFITQVEALEIGRLIDTLALEHGLRALAVAPTIRLSINMSARSVGYARWMHSLERGLAKDPTIAERLILEITESSALTVPELVRAFMSDMQRKHIAFALDDFGAGYTSLRYLREFKFDILKIDAQFCRDVNHSPDNQALIKAMKVISEQFEMLTVAEGVEKPGEAQWLAQQGINCIQGYLYGVPTVKAPWHRKQRIAS